MKIIEKFRGANRFLSNFYSCPVIFENLKYSSAEHAYQAAKTPDLNIRKNISKLNSPVKAKAAGYKINLRPDWENIKIFTMYQICKAKFEQNEELLGKLFKTEDFKLIEGNTWHDNFWGDCSCEKCKDIPGKNYLGKILMKIRKELEGLQLK